MSRRDTVTLTADDRRRLEAIHQARDNETLLRQLHDYWRDRARADRTPREFCYLHLGMLAGLCGHLLQVELPTSDDAVALAERLARPPHRKP